jgi:hypothetical protein
MTFEDEEIPEIPVTIHLETVNIFQDNEAHGVMKNYNYLPKNS